MSHKINTPENRKVLYSALKRHAFMSDGYKRVMKSMVYLLDNKDK